MRFLNLFYELVAFFIVFCGIGYFLDFKTENKFKVFTLIGCFLSVIAVIYWIIKKTNSK